MYEFIFYRYHCNDKDCMLMNLEITQNYVLKLEI